MNTSPLSFPLKYLKGLLLTSAAPLEHVQSPVNGYGGPVYVAEVQEQIPLWLKANTQPLSRRKHTFGQFFKRRGIL